MINLIPPDKRQSIRFGRLNTRLAGWLNSALFVFVGLAIITGGSLFYLRQDSSNLQESIDGTKKELAAQDEAETLSQVSEMSANFTLVVDVLSREILFSKLLQHLGSVMPTGTVLQDLRLSQDGSRGLTLSIGAIGYNQAAQALVNLQSDESLLFTGADATSINCENDQLAPYICIAQVNTILAEDNPFLLLNQGESNE